MNLHSIEAPFMASSKEEVEVDRVHKRHRVLLGNASGFMGLLSSLVVDSASHRQDDCTGSSCGRDCDCGFRNEVCFECSIHFNNSQY